MLLPIQDPVMRPGDVHILFDPATRHMQAYGSDGMRIPGKGWEAHGEGVRGPGFDHPDGDTVPGLYKCGAPQPTLKDESTATWDAYGYWFTPLLDVEGNEAREGRAGIGVHGGGTGLENPLAPRQGWAKTCGCCRVQNGDNTEFVELIHATQAAGHCVYFTVNNWGH